MKGRLEDRRLLTGQGRFISDWNFPNQAYCSFLRSDRAHAEIASVDAASALLPSTREARSKPRGC